MASTQSNLIDRLEPATVVAWLPEAVAQLGRTDVEKGRVARPAIRNSRISALVADSRKGRVRVQIVWDLDGPLSTCECKPMGRGPCRHAAALALLVTGLALPPSATAKAAGKIAADPLEAEIQARRDRGASELFLVQPRADAVVYGHYDVSSPSARNYEVVVRALDALHNGCTCPDFETNTLGTCKHIEAVLAKLRRDDLDAYEAAERAGVPRSYLVVNPGAPATLGVRLRKGASAAERRVLATYFSGESRLKGDLAAQWADLERAALEADIEVSSEAFRLAARTLDQAERLRRQAAIEDGVFRAGPEQPGFHATLYPYQVEGVAFLASRTRAILADDMGLGKTAQAIAAMIRLMRSRAVARTLIVCPTSLKHQWEREIDRFSSLAAPRVAIVGGPREQRRATYRECPEILITSYELARSDQADLETYGADLLILDEAQRIKNWRIQTAAAIKRISTRFAFVLTGTPVENRLDDLYSLMQVVDPHLLGPLWRFNQDFASLDDRGRPVGYRNLDLLRERLAPVLLRRRKEEVLTQLPPQIVNRLLVPMTPEQNAIHEDGEQSLVSLLGILKKRPLTPSEEQRLMRAFQRMRMACDAAGLVDKTTEGSPKLEELSGLLDEICVAGGRKVVIFSEWERMQAMAAAVCDKLGIGHVCLNGGVPSGGRGALIDRFRNDPRCKVFLSTDAGGVGLNLQVASHVINLDLPWNPAVLAQRIARVHRIGQVESVNVVLLISSESFEERMQATLGSKLALASAAIGDDSETTELTRSTQSSRIATLLSETFAASTGPSPEEEAHAGLTLDAAAAGKSKVPALTVAGAIGQLQTELGADLARVVRLPDGRLVGVLRAGASGAGASGAGAGGGGAGGGGASGGGGIRTLTLIGEAAGEGSGLESPDVVLLPALAVEALAALGSASPLAQAQVVYAADPEDAGLAARRDLLAAGERKIAAGHALVAAGMGGEALGLFRAAIGFACRALDDRGDPGDDPAALLGAVYGHLLPGGALDAAGAHALVRAGEVARAFGSGSVAAPEALVEAIAADVRDLLGRARERVGSATRTELASAATARVGGPALTYKVTVG